MCQIKEGLPTVSNLCFCNSLHPGVNDKTLHDTLSNRRGKIWLVRQEQMLQYILKIYQNISCKNISDPVKNLKNPLIDIKIDDVINLKLLSRSYNISISQLNPLMAGLCVSIPNPIHNG